MKDKWSFTFSSLVASLRSSLNAGKAGSGTILYSSSAFLLHPPVVSEGVAGLLSEVLLTTVLRLEQLAEGFAPSTTEVLLLDADILHVSNFLASMASSVIVFAVVSYAEQLHQGLKVK